MLGTHRPIRLQLARPLRYFIQAEQIWLDPNPIPLTKFRRTEMRHLTINDLHYTDELDASAMAHVTGGEKAKEMPKEKPIKLTFDNGVIIGEWANGLKMPIPL
jgi:hypothetical protein